MLGGAGCCSERDVLLTDEREFEESCLERLAMRTISDDLSMWPSASIIAGCI